MDSSDAAAGFAGFLNPVPLAQLDPDVHAAIQRERDRQRATLDLTAAENFTYPAVLEAVGSVLTNKYAEGYPGRRYSGGCEHVDAIEQLAIDRAKQLFGAAHANVQPHSGALANLAVFLAALRPGDKMLSLSLEHGGHPTLGFSRHFSGLLYQIIHYGVDAAGRLDYDRIAQLAIDEHPRLIAIGASAHPRAIDFERLGAIAQSVGAMLLADIAHIAGLVAAGAHPSPVPHADFVTTTTHKSLRGPRGGLILCKAEHAKSIDAAVMPGVQGGPLMHAIAGKAVCFGECLKPEFRSYGAQVVANARALATALQQRGYELCSGGTDNHLLVVDLHHTHPDLTGRQAQEALDRAHIAANKCVIPQEPRRPSEASGLRLGVPAVTTRGLMEPEMESIAEAIDGLLRDATSDAARVRAETTVRELCERFPLPY